MLWSVETPFQHVCVITNKSFNSTWKRRKTWNRIHFQQTQNYTVVCCFSCNMNILIGLFKHNNWFRLSLDDLSYQDIWHLVEVEGSISEIEFHLISRLEFGKDYIIWICKHANERNIMYCTLNFCSLQRTWVEMFSNHLINCQSCSLDCIVNRYLTSHQVYNFQRNKVIIKFKLQITDIDKSGD